VTRPPGPPPVMLPEPALTWFRLHAGITVIDFPLHTWPATRTWAATMWPDRRAPGGWVRHLWEPSPNGRGFIPAVVELGDVIQFGVEPVPAGRKEEHPPAPAACWHGYLHAVQHDSLLLHGPYPEPRDAYAAAQHALLARIHQGAASPGPANTRDPGLPIPAVSRAPVAPAQPPATVSLAFNGDTAIVGDPVHGWLVVSSEGLLAAMAHRPHELAERLRPHVPGLTGREPAVTLAALSAKHLGHLASARIYTPSHPTPALPTTATTARTTTARTTAGTTIRAHPRQGGHAVTTPPPDPAGPPEPTGHGQTGQPGNPAAGPPPDWDIGVLDHPVVLDVPDQLPPDPRPLLDAAIAAMVATAAGDAAATYRIGELARAGVVALRTSHGSFQLRESLLGWILVRGWGDPDPVDLAEAARFRAHRLARERRTGCAGAP
jgi:hypothetical protein